MVLNMQRITGLALVLGLWLGAAGSADAQGLVAGSSAKGLAIDQGELLIGELSCVSCHAAPPQVAVRLQSKQPPLLGEIGARMTPQAIADYLKNPHGFKPGTTMPDIFHASEAQPKAMAIDFLQHFLVSRGGPIKPSAIEVNSAKIDRGRLLFHQSGCVACHAPQEPAGKVNPFLEQDDDVFGDEKPAAATVPAELKAKSFPLGKIAHKTTVEALTAFLVDPLKVRPSGRMPHMHLEVAEAEAIASYLLREQANQPGSKPVKVKGLKYYYYERSFNGQEQRFDDFKPTAEGVIDRFRIDTRKRNDHFGFRFKGVITIIKPGKYTFYTRSDDGSFLWINDKLVVNNGGVHGVQERSGTVELASGDHTIEVTMFEVQGGEELHVDWSGPDIKKQAIPANVLGHSGKPMQPIGLKPFTVDARKAQMGARMFALIGCASCHKLKADDPHTKPFRPTKGLLELDPDAPEGCLGDNIRKGRPKYQLTAAQRDAIKKALRNNVELSKPLNDKQQVAHTMARLNCYACHARDGVGGPADKRLDYFATLGEAELGDEGRVPPALSGVGAKLTPATLNDLLVNGTNYIRPYMATRMPKFGKANAGHLTDAFVKLVHSGSKETPPEFTTQSVKDGRKLVGSTGLGCINCHSMAGQPSLGPNAMDLALVMQRLNPSWVHRFMANPTAVKPGTRMPSFYADGAVRLPVAGGDQKKQVDAIINYLSLGKSAPLPAGIKVAAAGDEIVPGGDPVVFRTFMTDASPRAIAVGYPERVHVAFDGNVVRLAKAWRGGFFDGKGTWQGRAGGFSGPLGVDVIDMPPGPAFAKLDSSTSPWPKVDPKKDRNVGGRFKGYRFDAERRPIFKYVLDGVTIEEQPVPDLRPGGAVLLRKFTLTSAKPTSGLYHVVAFGQSIDKQDDGTYLIDGKLKATIKSSKPVSPIVRNAGQSKELIVPVDLSSGKAAFEVVMSW